MLPWGKRFTRSSESREQRRHPARSTSPRICRASRSAAITSAGIILVIAIAASGLLMMRFRKRWLAKMNLAFTNRIAGLFAGWLPGFGILTHVGRKSGKLHRTPVNAFRASNGFIIALTYSSQSEWVKNVLGAGCCELKTRGKNYQLSSPTIVHDPTRHRFPFPVRIVLRVVGADE